MLLRLTKDEAGLTMALAVIIVAVVGVMGAGLLAFTMRDLNTVVQTNQGQTAAQMAAAGMQAGKMQLYTVDSNPLHYDTNSANGESSWSESATPSSPCTALGKGKCLSFGGNQITLSIRYLPPASNASQTTTPNSDYAPEILPAGATDTNRDPDSDPDYPNDRHYFRVTVKADTGNAVRWYQAIYYTQNYNFPVAYFATRDITINDNATKVNNVSLFAERYITNLYPNKNNGQCGTLCGKDLAYNNWATNPDGTSNAYNKTPRPTTDAGAAALGITSTTNCPLTFESGILYGKNDNDPDNKSQKLQQNADPQHYGVRDFDRDSSYKCSGSTPASSGHPSFTRNTWSPSTQPSNRITFPFAVDDTANDTDVLNSLKQKAQEQGHYVSAASGGGGCVPPSPTADVVIGDSTSTKTPPGAVYPSSPDLNNVTYIEFTGNTKGCVQYKTGGTHDTRYGTIVVVNGDFDTSSSSADLDGAVVVRDGVSNGSATGESNITRFYNDGSLDINGFVNVEGDLYLSGSVGGVLPGELLNGIPGVVAVNRWSWRECYNPSCS